MCGFSRLVWSEFARSFHRAWEKSYQRNVKGRKVWAVCGRRRVCGRRYVGGTAGLFLVKNVLLMVLSPFLLKGGAYIFGSSL